MHQIITAKEIIERKDLKEQRKRRKKLCQPVAEYNRTSETTIAVCPVCGARTRPNNSAYSALASLAKRKCSGGSR